MCIVFSNFVVFFFWGGGGGGERREPRAFPQGSASIPDNMSYVSCVASMYKTVENLE